MACVCFKKENDAEELGQIQTSSYVKEELIVFGQPGIETPVAVEVPTLIVEEIILLDGKKDDLGSSGSNSRFGLDY